MISKHNKNSGLGCLQNSSLGDYRPAFPACCPLLGAGSSRVWRMSENVCLGCKRPDTRWYILLVLRAGSGDFSGQTDGDEKARPAQCRPGACGYAGIEAVGSREVRLVATQCRRVVRSCRAAARRGGGKPCQRARGLSAGFLWRSENALLSKTTGFPSAPERQVLRGSLLTLNSLPPKEGNHCLLSMYLVPALA